jgi:spore coat polysaccharide biosynthesis predicted glycosyltransferase SpsG
MESEEYRDCILNGIKGFIIKHSILAFDWAIIDDYESNLDIDLGIREYARNILVIDDLNLKQRNCDVLLDMNYRRPGYVKSLQERYPDTRLIVGPKYAPLDIGYESFHSKFDIKNIDQDLIFINFGTLDYFSLTRRTIENLLLEFPLLKMRVVIQKNNTDLKLIEKLSNESGTRIELFVEPNNLAKIMLNCNLSIGAGGISLWERFCLGLNAITVATADNQIEVLIQLHEDGYLNHLGDASKISDKELIDSVKDFLNNRSHGDAQKSRMLKLVDGQGVNNLIDFLI